MTQGGKMVKEEIKENEPENSTAPQTIIMDKPNRRKKIIDISLLLPVKTRMFKRYKKIQAMGQAKIQKYMVGNEARFDTQPPKEFISKLMMDFDGSIAKLSYYVYAKGKDGNKVLDETRADVTRPDGTVVNIVVDARYRFEKFVVETIKTKEKIVVEEFDADVQ